MTWEFKDWLKTGVIVGGTLLVLYTVNKVLKYLTDSLSVNHPEYFPTLSVAKDLFEKANSLEPENTATLDGLAQVKQLRTGLEQL